MSIGPKASELKAPQVEYLNINCKPKIPLIVYKKRKLKKN